MNTKNCVVCSTPFSIPIVNRGTEKIYCSPVCRSKAGNERMFKKIINKFQPVQNETPINPSPQFTHKESQIQTSYPNGEPSFNSSIGYLERSYEAKIEALEYKLRLEGTLKDIENLKNEVLELESELNALPPVESKSEKVIMGLIDGAMPLFPMILESFIKGDKKVS
jgi:hypothetical protein